MNVTYEKKDAMTFTPSGIIGEEGPRFHKTCLYRKDRAAGNPQETCGRGRNLQEFHKRAA